jgi:hypothetical protein
MQVTTSDRRSAASRDRARHLASRFGWTCRRRAEVDWSEPVLVVQQHRLAVVVDGRSYAWHPGLLHARKEAGQQHPMIRAGALRPGDAVLDTTLGLGTDAAFLAHITGRTVLAVEASPVLALLVAEGTAAAGLPVRVICARSEHVLRALPDGAVDAVYCDPLFKPGRTVNHSLQLYREVGDPWRPGPEWLAEARRVARRRVVIKDEARGDLLENLGPDGVLSTNRGDVRYGWFGLEAG